MAISVQGTLTVNGRLSANGGNGDNNAGGGSGGSLYLSNIGTLAGHGVVSAHGGNASLPGGAGTVYLNTNGNSVLLVDNGGITGTNTPLGNAFTMPTNF